MRLYFLTFLFLCSLFMMSCAEPQTEQDIDYEATKKMVIDILQTDEGKKAIQDLMSSEEMKEQLVIDSDIVKKSIQETLVSERGENMWKKLFEDTAFVKDFAQATNDSHKQLIKQLMKDPEYQELLMDVLQNPEVNEQILQVLQSKKFREHLQKVIVEIVESPLFLNKLEDILLRLNESKDKEKEEKEKNE
ncbi:MAG TPA: spore germination lipoprotein GerD [Bacillota bacterium]|nr:spore germination lipoprotein GerD [Bacillota bacterium]